MQVSVIIPVLNEEASIQSLIEGLLSQTRPPDEIVITDAGSTDNTQSLIQRLQSSSKIPILLTVDHHAFPGRGRNIAIHKATNEWLACIDAGITPETNWLEELVSVVEQQPDAKMVQGRYEPVTDTYFKECAAIAYVGPSSSHSQQSLASCLLHRSAWEAGCMFPEDLRSGEDLIFFRRLKIAGVPTATSDKAVVHWHLQPDTSSTFRRFATYSRYGMKAGLGKDWQLRVTLMYSIFIVFMIGGLFLWWPLALIPILLLLLRSQRRIYNWFGSQSALKRMAECLNPRRVLTVTWINVVVDMAMFLGMIKWLFLDLIGKGSTSQAMHKAT
jgi:glycosyltransferase involved in cell wall biosynthesis